MNAVQSPQLRSSFLKIILTIIAVLLAIPTVLMLLGWAALQIR